jgi:rod shape-determining protein MreD
MNLTDYIKYAAIILILAVLQKTVMWLIALTEYEITPDVLLIAIVFLGVKKGKIAGSIGGFLGGLLFDVLSFSFLGLTALSKLIPGFLSGFFNTETKIERYTKSVAFCVLVFFCSAINNFIYFWTYFQGTNQVLSMLLIRYIIPTAIYTAIVSYIPVIFISKKTRRM